MLHPDPARRATCQTILQDPWYLNEDVSTPEDARNLFAERNLVITQLPAVRVTNEEVNADNSILRGGGLGETIALTRGLKDQF